MFMQDFMNHLVPDMTSQEQDWQDMTAALRLAGCDDPEDPDYLSRRP